MIGPRPGRPREWRPSGSPPSRQRGIAMLVAILLVALGTIIATAVAYESAMTARRGTATFSFDEALLVGEGSEALAAYGLRTYLQSLGSAGGAAGGGGGSGGPIVTPTQPWAERIDPIEVVPGVILEPSLEDLEGRFNLNWLVPAAGQNAGKPDPVMVESFRNLLTLAQVDPKWADMVVDWIDSDDQAQNQGAEDGTYLSQTPPYRAANQYITSTSELLALPKFGRENYMKLAPYIVALPPDTKLNVCSASPVVLDAFNVPGNLEYSTDTASFDKNRAAAPPNACFPDLNTYQKILGTRAGQISPGFETTSHYFRLTSLVTIGTTEFNLYSLLFMDPNLFIYPVQRSFSPD